MSKRPEAEYMSFYKIMMSISLREHVRNNEFLDKIEGKKHPLHQKQPTEIHVAHSKE